MSAPVPRNPHRYGTRAYWKTEARHADVRGDDDRMRYARNQVRILDREATTTSTTGRPNQVARGNGTPTAHNTPAASNQGAHDDS